MRQLRALDLCCGAGGASRGLAEAGFAVTGVDLAPQPRYPFPFIQADALAYLATADLSGYDLLWASWPCQAWSLGSLRWGKDWPDLLTPGRALMQATGLPYILENVPRAPLRNALTLCGTMFDLQVVRHRKFESNVFLFAPHHDGRLCRSAVRDRGFSTVAGNGGDGPNRYGAWAAAMDIDWMNKTELRQAIPPAYSAYLGRQIAAALTQRRAA